MMTSRLWHTGEDADCAAALELLNLGLKESEAEFPEAEEEASVLPGLQRQPPSALASVWACAPARDRHRKSLSAAVDAQTSGRDQSLWVPVRVSSPLPPHPGMSISRWGLGTQVPIAPVAPHATAHAAWP